MFSIKFVRQFKRLSSSYCYSKSWLLHTRLFSHTKSLSVPPYVGAPYSYAYGRSNKELLYFTISDLLIKRANEPDTFPAVLSYYEKIHKNFQQLNDDVCRVAKSLNERLGIQRGDVVSIWSLNSYNWIVLQFAIMKIGAILCTVNPYYQGKELEYLLRKAQVKAIFVPGKNSPQNIVNHFHKVLFRALEAEDSHDVDPILLKNIITLDGDEYSKSDLPQKRSSIEFHNLESLFKSNGDVSSKVIESVCSDDPSIIMFTSGTTGKPKGAVLSQFTVINNAILASSRYEGEFTKVFCVPLPFFHSFAGILGNIGMLATPFSLVIPCMKYDVKGVVEAINKYKVTNMMATPTLVIDLMNFLKANNIQIPTLKSMVSGGASMSIETAHQFVQAVPSCTDFRIGYGSTELGPCSTTCVSSDSFETRTETVGKPLDFVEIKVVNPETKQLVKLGETGEIYSRGYNTMLGYWRDESKTKEVIDQAQWYCTGDLGTIDEHGSLRIVGRTKDMIIVGGENVYPVEIEDVLHTFPGVSDAHVIGLPDDRRGEAVCAWIQMLPNQSATEEEVREFCEKHMAYFKVPKYFLFVEDFPMTTTGKAQKFIMRDITCKKLQLSEKK